MRPQRCRQHFSISISLVIQCSTTKSSLVGFITRTLEGRVDFKDNIYFRKETIEDNISSGIIDLRIGKEKRRLFVNCLGSSSSRLL